MTKRELLAAIETAPMDAELYMPESDMPGWSDVGNVFVSPAGGGMGGPYPLRRALTDDERKSARYGIFIK